MSSLRVSLYKNTLSTPVKWEKWLYACASLRFTSFAIAFGPRKINNVNASCIFSESTDMILCKVFDGILSFFSKLPFPPMPSLAPHWSLRSWPCPAPWPAAPLGHPCTSPSQDLGTRRGKLMVQFFKLIGEFWHQLSHVGWWSFPYTILFSLTNTLSLQAIKNQLGEPTVSRVFQMKIPDKSCHHRALQVSS